MFLQRRNDPAAKLISEMTANAKWYESWSNVIDLAEWLFITGRIDPANLFYMERHAWKYEAEWMEFQAEENT